MSDTQQTDTDDSTDTNDQQTTTYADRASQQKAQNGQSATNGMEQPPTGATDEAVGHVVVLDDLVVTHTGEDSSIKAFINREDRADIKTGTYVQIPYPSDPNASNPECNEEMFAMVEAVRYLNQGEIDELKQTMQAVQVDGETNERRYDQVVSLDPIAIITKEEEDSSGEIVPADRKNVDTVPKPFTWVYHSNDEAFLRTGLNIPEEGLPIGYLAKNGEAVPKDDPLVYNVSNPGADEDGESAVFRHTLIAGSTGKGKTFFTKNYLRQLADGTEYGMESMKGQTLNPQLPGFIIIDPENEYSEMREDSEADDAVLQELERQGVQVNGFDSDPNFDLETYVPKVRGANAPSGLSSHREFSIPFHFVHSRPELAMPFETNEPTRAAMANVLNDYFQQAYASGGDPTYDDFMSYLDQFNDLDFENNELAQDNNITSGMWDALMRRFRNGTFQRVFDSGADYIDAITNEFVRPGQVTVVPTKHLDPAAEKLVVMSLMSLVVENKIGSGNDKNIYETPLILGVDEAHNYLSENEKVQDQYIVRKFRQVAKQGRKYKLGLFMVTQNPEDIDEELLKQTNSKIFLGLEPEVLTKLPTTSIQEFTNMIPNFGKGQAVVKAPDVEATEIQGFNVCLVRHSK